MQTNNSAFNKMIQAGFSREEAALACGMDVDGASLGLVAAQQKTLTVDELIEQAKPSAIKVVVDILEDPACEPKDRLAAAKLILQGEGKLPDIGFNQYEERFARIKKAKDATGNPIIELASVAA